MIGLSLGLGFIRAASGGGAPPQAPFTKIVFEGDSITAAAGSQANQWMANNPSVAAVNLAVASSRIQGANSLTARLSALAAEDPSDLAILIGTNDLHELGVSAWLGQLDTYLSAARSACPSLQRIYVGLITPTDPADRPNLAEYRATVNPALRALVGDTIEAIVPFGEHPLFGVDSAGVDTNYYYDGIHPTALTYSYMLAQLDAVLAPVLAEATGSVPSGFTTADVPAATASTEYLAYVTVTGMGLGSFANASSSGAGDMARGTGSFGAGPVAVMNGDVVVRRVTSSGTSEASVSQVLTIGGVSDDWTLTTSAPTATSVFDPARSAATLTFTNDRHVYGDNVVNGPQVAVLNQGHSTGKFYFEVTFGPEAAVGVYQVSLAGTSNATNNRPGTSTNISYAGVTYRNTGQIYLNGTVPTGYPAYGAADTIGVAFDAGAKKVWFLKNGVSIDGDPETGTGGFTPVQSPTAWYGAVAPQRADGHQINCGQDAFNYAPPAGFAQYG